MSKQLKINIKNAQLAKAIDLGELKDKLKKPSASGECESEKSAENTPQNDAVSVAVGDESEGQTAPKRKVKARTRSVFAPRSAESEQPESHETEAEETSAEGDDSSQSSETRVESEIEAKGEPLSHSERSKSTHKASKFDDLFSDKIEEKLEEPPAASVVEEASCSQETPLSAELPIEVKTVSEEKAIQAEPEKKVAEEPIRVTVPKMNRTRHGPPPSALRPSTEKLGPTGRHVRDIIPPKKKKPQPEAAPQRTAKATTPESAPVRPLAAADDKAKFRDKERHAAPVKGKDRSGKGKFDSRDRQGLRSNEETPAWRKKTPRGSKKKIEIPVVRPSELKVRLPITIKDLAAEMKLKASEIIQKLFLQGVILTINDYLEDELTVQLLGEEFKCAIEIDSSERDRIQITQKSVQEEIREASEEARQPRPPVVAFMGHVDHGKTSLIDKIRESNRAADEAGAITQHIGAFECETPVGKITFLDTPGHEAFSAMRARGADVTDIVVLVVAGDEGVRVQTIEAIQHARAAGVTILVAINKCDKPHFDAENVYRQLAEHNLLPEAWGGDILTINCSAVTGEGISQLLEMLALQAEVLELQAVPEGRARGRVIESELNKGMGVTSTILILNGTLRVGDALVFDQHWGRVKTMTNDLGVHVKEAPPSAAVEITGLSGLPDSGEEFIVVENEREARSIAEARMTEMRESTIRQRRVRSDNLLQMTTEGEKKALNLILRADVQGSVEALKNSLERITSDKAELQVIFSGVGEISESDIQLAMASNAAVIGFHVQVESHANQLIKESGVQVFLYDVIYRAVDEVKALMEGLLDKVAVEETRGSASVLAVFRSSQLGNIAGCQVDTGTISRNHSIRVKRDNELVWQGGIRSIKRLKEDVREVKKGFECGILLDGFNDVKEGDILEAFEIVYYAQEL